MIQEVEQILEAQDSQMLEEAQLVPPRDSLIPPGHSTGTPSPIRDTQGKEQEMRGPPETTPTRRAGDRVGKLLLSHLIPEIRSPREKSGTQSSMQSNKLLGLRQKPPVKGKLLWGTPQSTFGIQVMMEYMVFQAV